MPIIVAVDHDRREVNVIALGPVTFADALSQLDHELREGGVSYRKFVDARGAGVLISPEENLEIAEKMRTHGRKVRVGPGAFLVSSDAAFEAINGLAALVADVCAMKVFRDEHKARAWLAAQPI